VNQASLPRQVALPIVIPKCLKKGISTNCFSACNCAPSKEYVLMTYIDYSIRAAGTYWFMQPEKHNQLPCYNFKVNWSTDMYRQFYCGNDLNEYVAKWFYEGKPTAFITMLVASMSTGDEPLRPGAWEPCCSNIYLSQVMVTSDCVSKHKNQILSDIHTMQ